MFHWFPLLPTACHSNLNQYPLHSSSLLCPSYCLPLISIASHSLPTNFLFKSFVFYCLPFPSTSLPITFHCLPLISTILPFPINSHCLLVFFLVPPSALCQPLLASPCLPLFLIDSHHILTDFLPLPPTTFHHLPFILVESQCIPIVILLFPTALLLSIIDFYCHPLLSN